MTWWQAVLLGLLQGVTEFLPVSSSGHLALAQMLIPGFEQPGVVLDAMLHVGTAAAVVWFERRSLRRWLSTGSGLRLLGLLVVGTLATAVLAFPLRRVAEAGFEQALLIGLFLIVTGGIVLATRVLPAGGHGEESMGWWRAVVVGLAQGVAVFPGLSRSGVTIAASLSSGLERSWAVRFSFLLSVPAIAGATLVEVVSQRAEVVAAGSTFWLGCAIGAVAAGVSGLVALKVVLRTVNSRVFHRFAWYCLPLGALVMAASWGGLW